MSINPKYLKKYISGGDRERMIQPVRSGRELATDAQIRGAVTELLKLQYQKEIGYAAIQGYAEVFEMAAKAADYYPGATEGFASIVEAVRQCIVETIISEGSF